MGVSGGRVALRVWDACCLGGWLLAAALVVERLQGGAWPPLRLALAAVLGGSPPTKSSLWYVGTLQAWPPLMDWNPISRLVAVLEAGRCIETVLILLGACMQPTGMQPTGMQPTGMQPTGMQPSVRLFLLWLLKTGRACRAQVWREETHRYEWACL